LNHIIKRSFKEEKWRNVSYLKEGDVIPLGGQNFEVVYVPGHSQTDILLWDKQTGDTFSGDHLVKAFSVNAFIEPPIPGNLSRPKPLLQYRRSLDKISRLPLKTVYPGHGESFSDHQSLIQQRLIEQENRCEQIVRILFGGPKSIFEICTEMYPRLKDRMIFLGLSQIQGHIDLLETRNRLAVDKRGSISMYRLMNE
jgi:glyoxylase-like metal-dependent hydrolase (beta-lactamase superfamily II)